ncbi:MAG: hypothetical protein AMJ69_00670 [Gammaproteobacteria bacterium SG8_47]|nr:MAG: hypothetical protein AMJ69_00670 [Gammaproteobacteria bacterium SG8_47]
MSRLVPRVAFSEWRADWRAVALALVAGAALPLAFAPFRLYPLSLLLPAVLFWLWQGASPRRAAHLGYWFGFGMFAVGVSWVYVAIHVYGYTSAPIAGLLTLVFVAGMALFYAFQGYLSGWLLARVGNGFVGVVVVLPATWVLVEWVRSWFLTGFPWLSLGYSQLATPLLGVAPWFGVFAVSWACALTAGAALLFAQQRGRVRLAALVLLLGVWLVAGTAGTVNWSAPVGDAIKVSVIQGNVPQLTKWDGDMIAAGLARYADLTRSEWDYADLIVWPENALTLFYHQVEADYINPLAQQAQEHGVDLVFGVPILERDSGRYYATLSVIGNAAGAYRKRHLVPFGEYVPLENVLRGLIGFFDLPMSDFSPGPAQQPLLRAAGQPLAVSVCYEDAFGNELIRALPDATLLLNGSNNAWYGDSLAPHQHLEISRMRSVETQRDAIRATTNGISALIDYRGDLLATSAQFESAVLRGSVQPRSGATPYVRWGDWPVVIATLVLVLIAVLLVRGRAQRWS